MTAILNKKVLLAGSVIMAVAVIILGATYAAWQAQDTIDGNTVSTATLSITATGTAMYGAVAKPIEADNVLPGWESDPVERAEITNNSTTELDLWFYVENLTPAPGTPGACDAIALAWRASTPGDGSNYMGYGDGYEGTQVGEIDDHSGVDTDSGEFSMVENYLGAANAVKIAEGSNGFGEGEVIAMRQIAGFVTDADYDDHSGTCTWNEVFVGTMPGEPVS